MTTLFEQIGGDQLRVVIEDFYRRVLSDVMIGFMFVRVDRRTLVQREWELIAALLGAADIKYSGRPMRVAHAQHTIFGGQFERRMQILRETLRDHAVADDVQREWIDHALSLRKQITRDHGSECQDTGEAGGGKLAPVMPVPGPEAVVKLRRR
jgi:hemoglobin|nr:group 1 truncated hemoglobin [Kofleriaceae bacterium]